MLVGATSALAMFLAALDFSVNVALPEIGLETWTLTCRACSGRWWCSWASGPAWCMGAGSFADRFGLRRVYLWGGMAYLVSMFCIALSPDLSVRCRLSDSARQSARPACTRWPPPSPPACSPPHRRGLSMGFTTGQPGAWEW